MRALSTLGVVVGSWLLVTACATADGDPKARIDPRPEGPLVLELFTSQGCSSCPPADRLLARLAAAGVDGREVAPLSFHVDYWDDLGWPDPYASPAWTERQRQYARALEDGRVYTPELVVGGATGVVGSNVVAVTRAIARTPRPTLLPATATWSRTALEVTATAPADADVLVAIWEDGNKNKVRRGENAGETLAHARVVRRLERVARAGVKGSVTIKLDPAWQTVGAVAFAQRSDKQIVASVLLPRR